MAVRLIPASPAPAIGEEQGPQEWKRNDPGGNELDPGGTEVMIRASANELDPGRTEGRGGKDHRRGRKS